MSRLMLAIVLSLILAACGTMRAKEKVSQGLLELDQPVKVFLDLWGNPNRTLVISGDEIIKGSLSGYSGSFYKGKENYQVWIYSSRKTELVFSRQQRLVGWKTDLSVEELAAPSK